MTFNGNLQSSSESQERDSFLPTPEKIKKVELSIESAVQFQGALFARYFVDKNVSKAEIFENHDVMAHLMWKYAKAFRDYCDLHQDVAREILYCHDNIDALSEETITHMVAYIKAHPVSDEEIEKGYSDLDKYKVKH